jgi:medium-chain acyl-[acyl-carrier-protein] hydrolase
MNAIFRKQLTIGDTQVNAFDRLKNSQLLGILQEAAGEHGKLLGVDKDTLKEKDLFWALIRYHIEITRLPRSGETIMVETWPMPTTRTAYPRATVAYDADGNELFRAISLFVLVNFETRAMVLPAVSGVAVNGWVRGNELSLPGSLLPKALENSEKRLVRFSDLDFNGHMNNCRYMEWVDDLLGADFHADHSPKEMVICYHSEAREGEIVDIAWALEEGGILNVDASRKEGKMSMGHSRVFSVKIQF